MGLLGTLGNIIGNDTSFGQDVNGLGNIYQSAMGQPKSQLIGTAVPQQPNTNSTGPSIPAMPTKQGIIGNILKNVAAGGL